MTSYKVLENDLTGKLEIFYTGSDSNYQKLIVEPIKGKLLTFDNSTNPTIQDFLSGLSKIEFDYSKAGIWNIELHFLDLFVRSQITVDKNKIFASAIYNDFLGFDEIQIDNEFYEIDKEFSAENYLFLKRPVKEGFYKIYKVRTIKSYFSYLTPLKNEVVDKTINLSSCCDLEKDRVLKLAQKIRLIESLNDFSLKKKVLDLC